ncbi:MAG: sensor domain-containing diguanylate cyclase [Xanthobacteraceae bacterium]|nr:sensor domain-containing diguanylate cyclase [Xanthobacteraceae bacterium]
MKMLQLLRSALTRSSRAFIWSATACGLLVLLTFFVIIGYDFYRYTLAMNEQSATNVASLTGQEIARTIELYDLSIQSVAEGITDPDILYQEPGLRQKILFDKSATAPGLGAIVALDDKGEIFMDSWSEHPRRGNFSDREYFAAHRDATHDIGLYVSEPFGARLQNNVPTISLSRRLSKPDGSFAGVVSGTMRLDYFQAMFNRVSLGKSDSLVLLKDDGALIAHNAAVGAPIGADWSAAPVFKHLAGHLQGTFISEKSTDGVRRLYAFHRLPGLPLLVVVGMSTEQIFAAWWTKMLVLAAIFAIMAGSVVMLVWLLESELHRRAAAEAAAEELARTDGLTQLANRRWFDEDMSRKWARTARDGLPMSMLMIDVDHFKPYNDTYGHQAGDEVLIAVAEAIKGAVRRPDDVAARYGGEEFAVLLPDTNEAGASQIAATIGASIRRLRIEHAGSEYRLVTVSIGVATAMPHTGMTRSGLIRCADTALYRAKEDGRNRVHVHNVTSADFGHRVSKAG